MKATLVDLLTPAHRLGYAVPCFNVFGHEEAVAVIRAAEAVRAPVILATNREMTSFMGVRGCAGMLGLLAEEAEVPVCVHLDHCDDIERIEQAVNAGYSSVMYDGSQLPLAENIANSRRVVACAHAAGVSVEGEIGSVPYQSGRDHIRDALTEPAEAQRFAQETGLDAVAVAVGTVHRLESVASHIDFERLAAIAEGVLRPLVIHGASGVADNELSQLAAGPVCKCNIGTSLRMAFGRSLRQALADAPNEYDRLTLFAQVMPAMQQVAAHYFEVLGATNRVVET